MTVIPIQKDASGNVTQLSGKAIWGYSGSSFNDFFAPGQRGQNLSFEFVGPNSPNPGISQYGKDWTSIGPAVGFAWQVPWFGSGKTTVRGGYQISYQSVNSLGGLNRTGPGLTDAENLNTNPNRPLTTNLTINNFQSYVPVAPTVQPLGIVPVTSPSSTILRAYDPNRVNPYTENIVLSVTRDVARERNCGRPLRGYPWPQAVHGLQYQSSQLPNQWAERCIGHRTSWGGIAATE
jgi:hypothetical protein